MFANGRKTIGVFISRVHSEFQATLSEGISSTAKELGYNVAFFTNFGGYGQHRYDIGELNILNIPNYEDFAGIIVATDTIAVQGMENIIKNNIKKDSKCPVVSVRRKVEEYYNVLVNDNLVLEDTVRHFIEVHGLTRINFLSGAKGFRPSEKRLESYKRILKEYNIPIEEDRIYYGDMWRRAGYDAVNTWLKSPLERPQAIVCANDYMAITICNALAEQGISVPEDIVVSGCDDVEDAIEYSPSITTVRVPVFEMGKEAVDKIHNINVGVPQDKITYVNTVPIYRESCGCKEQDFYQNCEFTRKYIKLKDKLQAELKLNSRMSTGLAGLTKLEEVDSKIYSYVYNYASFSSFYMCLQENWDVYNESNEEHSYCQDNMIMEVGMKNGVRLGKTKFSRKDLIPPVYTDIEPQIFYFSLLHHQESCFGYVAINYKTLQTHRVSLQAWMINICNALENVRMYGELNRLVFELEDMYIRDALTGLYNRRGLEQLSEKYLKACVSEQKGLFILAADIDNLKEINDKYGHASGDISIKAVADALQKAADDDEICARKGGDEFTVFGMQYDEEMVNQYIQKFVREIDKFNEESNYKFKVCVSCGWYLVIPNSDTQIEICMNIADRNMYLQKIEKRNHLAKA